MGNLLQDLRYGFRMLLKSPAFTAVAVLALALGIGANSAIFSVVNTVILQPLPFARPEQLVKVYVTAPKRGIMRSPTSFLNFVDWRDQNSTIENMAAYSSATAILAGGESPQQVAGVVASGDFFATLAAKPALGRTFTRAEERADAGIVVISDGLWKRRFGGDPKIVGQQIIFNGESTTVIGVMPQGFHFPLDENQVDFWSTLDPQSELNLERGANYLQVIARLREGTTLEQAQAEVGAIMKRSEEANPDRATGRGINIVSMHEDVVGDIRPALLVLLGAVGLVLLIACANVANLLLARAASRAKEIAIRTALGASRWRVMRQLLTESLLLSMCGAVLGLLLALWGVDLLVASIPAGIPRVAEINLDARVLVFTFAVSILTGLFFGLAPALQVSKPDLNEGLKEGGRGSTEGLRRNRIRSLLVVFEVMLSLVLLISAGLLIRSFLSLRDVKPGFNAAGVLTATVALPDTKYKEEAAQAAFFEKVLERIAGSPGVEAVAAIDPLPLGGSMAQNGVTIEGRPPVSRADRVISNSRVATPDYFRAMGIPIIRGRAFNERDTKDAPKVLIINETFARKNFPGEDPIGKRMSLTISEDMTGEIIGIVGDVKHQSLEREAGSEAYVNYKQVPRDYMTLIARSTSGDPSTLAATLRNAVAQTDKDQPVDDIRTMEQILGASLARRRFNMLLLGIFASVALLLAAMGIYGVMNYSVTQRTHEIGIRIALGAQARDVLRLVVGQGMLLIGIGVALGLAISFALTRVMSSLLFGVSSTDPLTFIGVALMLAAIALIACYIPARRATKVDPMIALRYE